MTSYRHNGALFAIPLLLAGALTFTVFSSGIASADTAPAANPPAGGSETITPLPDFTATAAGEPLFYLSMPDPVISSDILTIPPGACLS